MDRHTSPRKWLFPHPKFLPLLHWLHFRIWRWSHWYFDREEKGEGNSHRYLQEKNDCWCKDPSVHCYPGPNGIVRLVVYQFYSTTSYIKGLWWWCTNNSISSHAINARNVQSSKSHAKRWFHATDLCDCNVVQLDTSGTIPLSLFWVGRVLGINTLSPFLYINLQCSAACFILLILCWTRTFQSFL